MIPSIHVYPTPKMYFSVAQLWILTSLKCPKDLQMFFFRKSPKSFQVLSKWQTFEGQRLIQGFGREVFVQQHAEIRVHVLRTFGDLGMTRHPICGECEVMEDLNLCL